MDSGRVHTPERMREQRDRRIAELRQGDAGDPRMRRLLERLERGEPAIPDEAFTSEDSLVLHPVVDVEIDPGVLAFEPPA